MEKTTTQRVHEALRGCGHYLHHHFQKPADLNPDELLAGLSKEEQEQLLSLLNKCLVSWNQKPR